MYIIAALARGGAMPLPPAGAPRRPDAIPRCAVAASLLAPCLRQRCAPPPSRRTAPVRRTGHMSASSS